jgi:hypothetical protein
VKVGEAGNLAILTKDEWNVLADLIQSGQLTKERGEAGSAVRNTWAAGNGLKGSLANP